MRIVTVITAAVFLVACSSSEDEARQREETVGKEIADGYNRQMDKARAVEDLSFDHKNRLDEAVQESENPPPRDP